MTHRIHLRKRQAHPLDEAIDKMWLLAMSGIKPHLPPDSAELKSWRLPSDVAAHISNHVPLDPDGD